MKQQYMYRSLFWYAYTHVYVGYTYVCRYNYIVIFQNKHAREHKRRKHTRDYLGPAGLQGMPCFKDILSILR